MRIQGDAERFENLVLYFCKLCDLLSNWGRTKLAKMLFYADFEAHRELGSPLTGVEYIRMPKGPVPRPLFETLERMKKDGRLVEIRRDVGDFSELRPTAVSDPNLNLFSSEEIDLARGVVDKLRSKTARQLSAMSHDEPGWRFAGPNEVIPYSLALLGETKPPADSIPYLENAGARLDAISS